MVGPCHRRCPGFQRRRQPNRSQPQGSHHCLPVSISHPYFENHKLESRELKFNSAKVSNAATSGTSGLQWFKISQDGMDSSGKWGVDRMIAGGGWNYFTMPSCIAPGNYLMRVELIALHSAYSAGGAQFYVSFWSLENPIVTAC